MAVTGHRDLLAAEIPALRAGVKAFFEDLAAQFPDLQLELLSGLATGADTLVAEVALELSIPLVAVLPFPQAEYERDFTNAEQLATFRRLLEQARVLTLPSWAGASSADIHDDPDTRTRQYAQLGVFLSNHCQVLLALWDGKPSQEIGGTHGVVRYHLTAVMPGFAVSDESPNLLADNENDLAFHIVCSRDREDGAPDERFQPLETSGLPRILAARTTTPCRRNTGRCSRGCRFSRHDCRRFGPAIKTQARSLLDDECAAPVPEECATIDRYYQAADWLAVRYQRLFSRGLLLSHLLAVLMGLVFIVYSEMVEYSVLAWLFLGLFGVGIAFHMLGERREWHRKYLDYRALAEGLRVQVYWNLAGVVDGHRAEFAYDNFLQKQDVDLAWIRHVMRSASLQSFRTEPPDARWVEWVADRWVGHPQQGAGQLAYYESKALMRSDKYRRTQLLGVVALWTGVSMAVFLALFALRLSDEQVLAMMILMGVLPLIAGVYDAYSHKKADKELIKQYQFMTRIFTNARRLLDETEDVTFQRQVLKAVGSAALEEHAEWLLMHRERPLEHGGL